jgi:hypothetical protein
MFVFPRVEVITRAFLIAAILFNALVPTAAAATCASTSRA